MYKDVPLMHSIALKDLSENKIDATIGVFLDDNKNLVYSQGPPAGEQHYRQPQHFADIG